MSTVIVLSMAAVYLCVCALLSGVGRESDRKRERLSGVRGIQTEKSGERRRERGSGRLRALRASLQNRQRSKVLGAQISSSRSRKKLSEAEKMLQLADVQLTPVQFTSIKLLLGLALALTGRALGHALNLTGPGPLLLMLCGALCGGILPAEWLKSQVSKRKALFRDELPDVIDLLVVSVEAGLGFDAALLRLYQKNTSPLMQELMRAMQDIQYGMTKKEAYGNLSERCAVKELTSFVNALVQADQMGISVRTVLKSQSEALREERRQRAEEQALKAPVKMLLPLVIFIFPVIFIVILGPAAMNITEILK